MHKQAGIFVVTKIPACSCIKCLKLADLAAISRSRLRPSVQSLLRARPLGSSSSTKAITYIQMAHGSAIASSVCPTSPLVFNLVSWSLVSKVSKKHTVFGLQGDSIVRRWGSALLIPADFSLLIYLGEGESTTIIFYVSLNYIDPTDLAA